MEKMGFEPMVQKKLYVDLANQCLKPLSHFSWSYKALTLELDSNSASCKALHNQPKVGSHVLSYA